MHPVTCHSCECIMSHVDTSCHSSRTPCHSSRTACQSSRTVCQSSRIAHHSFLSMACHPNASRDKCMHHVTRPSYSMRDVVIIRSDLAQADESRVSHSHHTQHTHTHTHTHTRTHTQSSHKPTNRVSFTVTLCFYEVTLCS